MINNLESLEKELPFSQCCVSCIYADCKSGICLNKDALRFNERVIGKGVLYEKCNEWRYVG